jgi:hypothetical protein
MRTPALLATLTFELLLAFVPLIAADAEIVAIDRAKALLASRGRIVAAVIVVERWPRGAPSPEAFAMKGTIFVNSGGSILRAAVRSTVFNVVLASLLLHEHAHLLGADEQQAMQVELDWLVSEHAGDDVIQAVRKSISREERKRAKASASSPESK